MRSLEEIKMDIDYVIDRAERGERPHAPIRGFLMAVIFGSMTLGQCYSNVGCSSTKEAQKQEDSIKKNDPKERCERREEILDLDATAAAGKPVFHRACVFEGLELTHPDKVYEITVPKKHHNYY